MLISSSAINEYVVKVNKCKIINILLHNCINQMLECTWCITKAKWKHSILKQSIPCYKRRFFTVFRRKPDLVVPTGQINGTEVLCV